MRACIDTVIEEHGQDPVPAEHERRAQPAAQQPEAPTEEQVQEVVQSVPEADAEPKTTARANSAGKAKE